MSFSAAGSTTEVWVPVKVPKELDAAAVKGAVQSVMFDRKPDVEAAKRFAVADQSLVTKPDAQPTIVLKVSEIDKLRPGQYAIVIGFSGAKVPVEPLSLNLERRAALLGPATKQVIDIVKDFPIGQQAAPTEFYLAAGSDQQSSMIRSLAVSETGFARSDGSNVPGNLTASVGSLAAAGSDVKVSVAPTGFPVGTAVGKLVLKSPDMKAPFLVDVEVRTKRSAGWLVAVVMVGIAAGFLLRVQLQHQLELRIAQDRGADLLEKVNAELARTPDSIFREALRVHVKGLTDAVISGVAAEVDKKVVALESAWASEEKNLLPRLETQRDAATNLARLGSQSGDFPVSIRMALTALIDGADQALEKVLDRDAAGAGRVQERHHAAFMAALRAASISERVTFALTSEQYAALQPLLSGDHKSDVEKMTDPTGLERPNPFETVDAARTWIAAWALAGERRRAGAMLLLSHLAVDARTLLEQAVGKAAVSRDLLAAKVHYVQSSIEVIRVELASRVERGDFFSVPSLRTSEALKAVHDLLMDVLKGRDDLEPTTRDKIVASIQLREYFVALAGLPAPERKDVDPRPDSVESARKVMVGQFEAWPETRAASGLPSLGSRFGQAIRIDTPRELRAFRARTRMQIARMTAIQTGAVIFILGVASYALFGERFIGTYAELAGLFFWGFTADLSVAKLSDLAAGMASKPKTS